MKLDSPAARAWIAFLFHAPGLWWLAGVRLTRRLAVLNACFVGGTLAATAAGGWLAPSGTRAIVAVSAFLVGHFAWSVVLAHAMLKDSVGHAGEELK